MPPPLQGSTPEGLSSTPVEDKNDALTHPRIVEHGTTQLLPQDWRTLYQMSYDPTQTWSQPLAYAAPKKAGPRERAVRWVSDSRIDTSMRLSCLFASTDCMCG